MMAYSVSDSPRDTGGEPNSHAAAAQRLDLLAGAARADSKPARSVITLCCCQSDDHAVAFLVTEFFFLFSSSFDPRTHRFSKTPTLDQLLDRISYESTSS